MVDIYSLSLFSSPSLLLLNQHFQKCKAGSPTESLTAFSRLDMMFRSGSRKMARTFWNTRGPAKRDKRSLWCWRDPSPRSWVSFPDCSGQFAWRNYRYLSVITHRNAKPLPNRRRNINHKFLSRTTRVPSSPLPSSCLPSYLLPNRFLLLFAYLCVCYRQTLPQHRQLQSHVYCIAGLISAMRSACRCCRQQSCKGR